MVGDRGPGAVPRRNRDTLAQHDRQGRSFPNEAPDRAPGKDLTA